MGQLLQTYLPLVIFIAIAFVISAALLISPFIIAVRRPDPEKVSEFQTENEVDFSYSVEGLGRFRVNAFMQRGSISIVMRAIPVTIKSVDELGLQIRLGRRRISSYTPLPDDPARGVLVDAEDRDRTAASLQAATGDPQGPQAAEESAKAARHTHGQLHRAAGQGGQAVQARRSRTEATVTP